MADKEKIKAEIERLKSIADYQLDNCKVDKSAWSQQAEVCKKLLSFINSMPEMEESDRLTHSVTKISDQEPEEYKGILGEQLKYIDNEIQRLEKLKEESVSENLLDEIHNRWEDYPHIKWPKCPYKDFKNIACHFANWQKQQMMKNVTYGEVSQCTTYPYNLKIQSIKTIDKDLKVGDKVKLIIIKEE